MFSADLGSNQMCAPPIFDTFLRPIPVTVLTSKSSKKLEVCEGLDFGLATKFLYIKYQYVHVPSILVSQ